MKLLMLLKVSVYFELNNAVNPLLSTACSTLSRDLTNISPTLINPRKHLCI